ncbi:MAG: hypothetical protein J7527_18720, partial [Chitinophagaceae bacterium]|nr:hypothetical protein [Chitinophagaceae bacterium]
MAKVQYLSLGDDNTLKEGQFSITGKAIDFMRLIIQNCQRLSPTYDFTLNQVIDSDYKTISFTTINCLDALARIAEAFDTEYWIEGTRLSLIPISRNTGYAFRQGKQKGMYELLRKNVDNTNVITRLYAFGSEKNIPENYRNFSKRLKLPGQERKTPMNIAWSITDNGDGNNTYHISWDPPQVIDATKIYIWARKIDGTGFMYSHSASVEGPAHFVVPYGDYNFTFATVITGDIPTYSLPEIPFIASTQQPVFPSPPEILYLEKNIDQYGLWEATVTFDEIYPHRTGKVTGINAGNVFEFTDSGIDFDINNYLLGGAAAKITFNTGQLSGFSFEIRSYDHDDKKIILVPSKTERQLDLPSADFKPAIGDEYVITDIKMPQSYIDHAEAELLSAAKNYLDEISQPQVAYNLIFDPVFLRNKGYQLRIGDLIWIIDPDLQVNRKIRIVASTRNIVEENDLQVEVADATSKTQLQALSSGQSALNQSVADVNNKLQNNALLNNRI